MEVRTLELAQVYRSTGWKKKEDPIQLELLLPACALDVHLHSTWFLMVLCCGVFLQMFLDVPSVNPDFSEQPVEPTACLRDPPSALPA